LHRKPALHSFDAADAAIMTTVLKEVSKGFGGSTTGPSYISPLACRITHGEWAVSANFRPFCERSRRETSAFFNSRLRLLRQPRNVPRQLRIESNDAVGPSLPNTGP
jgi:hypothetical protein